jgi:tetratricopeptide (TPR) repeat protein
MSIPRPAGHHSCHDQRCEINRLRSAEEHYGQKRYAAAIQESDEFIPKANNGALRTRAELVRSNSYYQLGLIAVQRNSIDLAIRFFKLSNSSQADFELAKIYKSRLLEAATVGDFETQLLYLNSILREIPTSDLVPEMINRRIVS